MFEIHEILQTRYTTMLFQINGIAANTSRYSKTSTVKLELSV